MKAIAIVLAGFSTVLAIAVVYLSKEVRDLKAENYRLRDEITDLLKEQKDTQNQSYELINSVLKSKLANEVMRSIKGKD